MLKLRDFLFSPRSGFRDFAVENLNQFRYVDVTAETIQTRRRVPALPVSTAATDADYPSPLSYNTIALEEQSSRCRQSPAVKLQWNHPTND